LVVQFVDIYNDLGMVLNFNSGQTDQDYTAAQLKRAINMAYTREVNIGKQEGSRRHFIKRNTFSWPASQAELTLPSELRGAELLRINDITNTTPGEQLSFSAYGVGGGDVYFIDNNTLRWGTNGPAAAKTLQAMYLAQPQELVEDSQEPELVPPAYHELLMWSAACWLRDVADEECPRAWTEQRDELRLGYHKYISRGRPMDDPDWVSPRDSDFSEEIVF